jgi:ribosomal protein S27AE
LYLAGRCALCIDDWLVVRRGRAPRPEKVTGMNETCDRCGPATGAAYRIDRDGELYLCGRCASRCWRALSAQGWIFWPLGVHALAPQASAVPDYGPGRGCGVAYGPVEDAA